MSVRFPAESTQYRAVRDRLLQLEIELRRATEAVALARRQLPPGNDSLMIHSFMFPRSSGDQRPGPEAGQTALLPLAEGPCPSCTALLDQLEGAAQHIGQRVNLAVVAQAPLPRLLDFAKERGWQRLRLLSSAANSYNRDYLGETADGAQMPMLNVFHREGGLIRHFRGVELLYAPTDLGQDPRHVGTIEPLWKLFDLTPEGRGTDWGEQLSYACRGARV